MTAFLALADDTPVTGGVIAGFVIGINDAITPTGFAYLTNPFFSSVSIIPVEGVRKTSLKTM